MILATTTVEDVDRFLKEADHLGKPESATVLGQYKA